MKIKEVMSTTVEVVGTEDSLQDVAKKMLKSDCGCVIVIKDDRLIGMITDRDIAIRCIAEEHDPVSMNIEKIMTRDILYCRDTDDTDDVVRNMGENRVRRLPVLNAEKRLVGIVSLGDLASHTNYELCGCALGDICRAA
jgi:CBS domain-containing protein